MRLFVYKKYLIVFILFTFFWCFYFYFNKSYTSEYIPERHIVNLIRPKCGELFEPDVDPVTLYAAENWLPPANEIVSDSKIYQNISQNCDLFLDNKKYFLGKSKVDEDSFPIAFTIVAFKSASQLERLLRTIYRPWNYYCIHIDKKSDREFVKAINQIVKCLDSKFNNTISTKSRVDVQWGKMSVLTADLICMRELFYRYRKWKYLINLTGQEFPLKTNAELVKILKLYQGANNIEGTYKHRNEDRVPKIKIQIPLVWYKGAVHITVNRDFVKYIFESQKSKIILNALERSTVPDEQFFSTLNYNVNLRIRGSYIGDPDEMDPPGQRLHYFLTRYKNWGGKLCKSRYFVRNICIWGVGDLPKLVNVPHLFANKFYEEFQPATLMCLENWYRNKVLNEMTTGKVLINDSYYASLPFVKYRYQPPNA